MTTIKHAPVVVAVGSVWKDPETEANLGVVKELGDQGRRHFNRAESKCISNPRFQNRTWTQRVAGRALSISHTSATPADLAPSFATASTSYTPVTILASGPHGEIGEFRL